MLLFQNHPRVQWYRWCYRAINFNTNWWTIWKTDYIQVGHKSLQFWFIAFWPARAHCLIFIGCVGWYESAVSIVIRIVNTSLSQTCKKQVLWVLRGKKRFSAKFVWFFAQLLALHVQNINKIENFMYIMDISWKYHKTKLYHLVKEEKIQPLSEIWDFCRLSQFESWGNSCVLSTKS